MALAWMNSGGVHQMIGYQPVMRRPLGSGTLVVDVCTILVE